MSHNKLPGSGKSSFDLVDHTLVFRELGLTRSNVFLDIGCGIGNYVIAAAEIVGPKGIAYGIDGWGDGIETLKQRALDKGLTNITAIIADITSQVPLPDNSVDIGLMATVLHDFARDGGDKQALRETARVLKPGGILGIVEFKKIEGPPGPPMHIRISPADAQALIASFGFQQIKMSDLGPYTYLIVATKIHGAQ